MAAPKNWIDAFNDFVQETSVLLDEDALGPRVGIKPLEIEVPGSEAKDVSISVDGSRLTIVVKGRRPFTRSYLLSVRIDPSNIRATVKNGLLTLEFGTPDKPSVTVPVTEG